MAGNDNVLKFGLRHDPMRWVKEDNTLQGALVRTFVFEEPKEGDSKVIQDEIDIILSAQLEDGRLSNDPNHSYQFTSEALIKLAQMGCPADREEVAKAVKAGELAPQAL